MQVVTLAATVGYLFLLGFLGGLLSRLRQADPDGALPWVAFASLLMFTTALNIAIGLDIAGGLLLRSTNGSATYTLHSAGFILAAPAALLGTAFFVAVAAVTFHTRVFPRATAWIAIVGVSSTSARSEASSRLRDLSTRATAPSQASRALSGS